MNRARLISLSTVTALSLAGLTGCMTRQDKIGGLASLVLDPGNAIKDEPPPTPPNNHMPPVYIKPGGISMAWVEDLTKTATNDEPDPDAKKPPVKKAARKKARR